ncbi:MAG: zf-HC2 domain-containing protein [Opitutaceae bacterium]|nr:zf-HC2 domain-containing protein [Opitutaceae bacterium]
MSPCRTFADLLLAELDGALSPAELVRIESHVSTCAECHRQRALLAATRSTLRQVAADIPTPDANREWTRLQQRIHNAKSERRRSSLLRRGLTWGLPIAAAALVAVSVSLVHSPVARLNGLASASADFVQAEGTASTLVYVDQESGWLIVWADSGTGNDAG